MDTFVPSMLDASLPKGNPAGNFTNEDDHNDKHSVRVWDGVESL